LDQVDDSHMLFTVRISFRILTFASSAGGAA